MMSDVEEPPVKVLKMEVVPSSLDSTMEGQEEGQEEWLSEGVLTDDDYLPGNVTQEQIAANINEALSSAALEQDEASLPETKNIEKQQNIEDTLNDFEKNESEPTKDAFDELFKKQKEDDKEQPENVHNTDEDDGHNTDDLLRMLGEDNSKMKKKVLSSMRDKKARTQPDQSSDDDDDYLFEGAKVTRLKVAKNALIRKQPTKAEPEGLSDRDSDMSEDEGSTVKKMFGTTPRSNQAAGRAQRSARPYTNNAKTEKPTPTTKYTNKPKSLLKPQTPGGHEEIINEEEFLEDDDFDLDEDMDASSLASDEAQTIRRPERMDEEVPSDGETNSEDDSLYDCIPSSDSEDMDDWFTLDIRAERAGDYLPWLGEKAHKLLTEEKHRVTARLAALKHSVSALKSSERVQSDQIKVATEALHELDAMLAAA